MPATRDGVYHNLLESKYILYNGEFKIVFSSKFYMNKFLNEYKEHREIFTNRIRKVIKNDPYNYSFLADLYLYQDIEKRGFLVRLKGVKITWLESHQFALHLMTKQNINDWSKTPVRKLEGYRKTME